MKIIRCLGETFMVCADTAKANRGGPIHFPDPDAEYALMPCLSVRMLGVCRCVDAEQAERYVDAIAAAFHFCNTRLRESLRAASAPLDAAYSYDRCIVVGGYTPMAAVGGLVQQQLVFRAGEGEAAFGTLRSIIDTIGEHVALVTRHVSLNTGDYLLIPLCAEEQPAVRTGRYALCLGERYVLDEHVQ